MPSDVAIKFYCIGPRLSFESTALYKFHISCGGDKDVLYDLNYSSSSDMDDKIRYSIIACSVFLVVLVLSALLVYFLRLKMKKNKRQNGTIQMDHFDENPYYESAAAASADDGTRPGDETLHLT